MSVCLYVCGCFVCMIILIDLTSDLCVCKTQTVSVLQYHEFHDAPSRVYDRIRQYQSAVHRLESGIHTNAIIHSLPRGLRNDVLVELCAGVVRTSPPQRLCCFVSLLTVFRRFPLSAVSVQMIDSSCPAVP